MALLGNLLGTVDGLLGTATLHDAMTNIKNLLISCSESWYHEVVRPAQSWVRDLHLALGPELFLKGFAHRILKDPGQLASV